ncbi:acetyltransferase, partial [Aureobasidium pullulans]
MSNTPQRPLGEKVANTNPAPWPSKEITMEGKYVTLEPISAVHAETLFPLIGGPENAYLWDYMPYDPCPSSVSALHEDMVNKAASTDPTFYTILKHVDGKKEAVGWCSYLRIEPKNRVIEVGHLMFSSALQKSAAATEAMYLMAKYAFEM